MILKCAFNLQNNDITNRLNVSVHKEEANTYPRNVAYIKLDINYNVNVHMSQNVFLTGSSLSVPFIITFIFYR